MSSDLAVAIAGTLVLAFCLVIFLAPKRVVEWVFIGLVIMIALFGVGILVMLWLSGLGIIAV